MNLRRLLLFACASPAAVLGAIDQRLVAQAAAAGMSTVDIALQLNCTPRRIQQILAFLRPPPAVSAGLSPQLQSPPADALLEMMSREIQRHGDYYGVQMLFGALRQWHPEHHFPRRAVAAAAAALRPGAMKTSQPGLEKLRGPL